MAGDSEELELWQDIEGFPGYQISNMGRLKSHRPWDNDPTPPEGRLLKGGVDKDGYRRAVLCDGIKRRKSCRIAQLVAKTWIGPCPKGLVLCHDNGNRTDNRVVNLLYKTQKENIGDKERHGTKCFGETHIRAKLTEIQVLEIRSSSLSRKELAEKYRISTRTIHEILHRTTWTHI